MINFFDALIGCKSRAENKNENLESRTWILKFAFLAQKGKNQDKKKRILHKTPKLFLFPQISGYVKQHTK